MERSTEPIGRGEFSDVWDRVTKGVADPPLQASVAPLSSAVQPLVQPLSAAKPSASPLNGRPSGAVPISDATPLCAASPLAAPQSADAQARAIEAARLREIMGRIAMTGREACQAAKQCGARAAEVLRCIERSCRATNRSLNAQYYILTDECCCPGSSLAPTCCGREAIRNIAAREAETREMCLAAAENTSFPSLELAYTRAARDCLCRERAAERLLAQTACN